tara:strand:+ start:232 stop:1029 length:798 start_codon:yes stop_codon:yes gene_type:complete
MKMFMAGSTQIFKTFLRNNHRDPVRLLVSYAYRKKSPKAMHKSKQVFRGYNVKEWILDSGAFSVYAAEQKHKIGKNSDYGESIDHDHYIEYAKESAASYSFGLDVIGDPDGTRKNLEREWKCGLNSIPTIHYGQATQERIDWAKSGPTKRIAIGGVARKTYSDRLKFISKVFEMAWPASIHGLGISDPNILFKFPFTSVDASLGMSAVAFGRWEAYGSMALDTKKPHDNMWCHVTHRQDLERRLVAKWKPLWDKLKKEGIDVYNY